MLRIGSFATRDCAGLTRRAFLQAGAALPLACGAAGLAAALRAAAAEQAPPARSVVILWLWGGPSHLDTFDPKPRAPAEYRGPFTPIATRTPGVWFSELLPQLAARSDRFALVRTNRNSSGDHLLAGTIALTGAGEEVAGLQPVGPPGEAPPNFGSILGRHRGHGLLPPFISLGRDNPWDGRGAMRGYGGGTWGRAYDPYLVTCDEKGEVDIPALQLIDGLSPSRLHDRRLLLAELDGLRRRIESGPIQSWDRYYQQAYELLTSPAARGALELAGEPEETRAAYGYTAFGQSCLLARRLVEADVPYIQVNWSQYVEIGPPPYDFGWDTHTRNFEYLADRHCPILDRAFSALLDDLEERGLLETTLVLATGEFGRQPRIGDLAAREHWPQCYSSIWAGAGVQPGRAVGSSDRLGEEPLTEPITPDMVGTTILERAGMPSEARARLQVLPRGRVIHELF